MTVMWLDDDEEDGDGPTIDTYCPDCGTKDEYPQSDWDCSLKPEPIVGFFGRNMGQRIILGITCNSCNKEFPPADWHRARERHVFAALGFMTPRLMKEAKVTA